jgi:hypothetical protein
MFIFAFPRIMVRRRALHAGPDFQRVGCTLSTHRPLLSSITPALANLSTIPNKYHVFISPPLRRVYLGDGEDDDLKLEISNLKARVVALTRDNKCLSKDLLAAQSDVTRLTSSERAARLALEEVKEGARVTLDKEKEEMRLANRRLDELTALCGALSLKAQ